MLCLCAQTLLIGAILHRKLLRVYPFFVAYVAVELVCSLLLIHLPVRSHAYADAYRTYQSIVAVFQLGMAAEVFHRLCSHFRQFRGMGQFRFIMGASLLTLTGFFFLAVFPRVPAPYPHLVVVWISRWETSVLAITLPLSWWILTRFLGLRPQMRSNALAHGLIMTAYFAFNAVCYALSLTVIERPIAIRASNVGLMMGTFACWIAWIICLRRDGEQLPPEPPVSPEALEYSRVLRRKILEYVQQAGR